MFFQNNKNIFEEDVIHYVNGVITGRYSIPAFQREYAWGKKRQKILDCLDSIYRGFNLGSIIFWESQFSAISRKKQNIHNANNDESIFYLVDGQQRTLTLVSLFTDKNVVGLNDKEIFINYDKKTEKLKFESIQNKEPNSLSMSLHIFKSKILNQPKGFYDFKDDDTYVNAMSYESEMFNSFKVELLSFRDKLVSKKLIIGYKLLINPKDLNEAIAQFEKINAAGIKLSEFNILDAVAFSDNRYTLSSKVNSFKKVNFHGISTTENKFTSDLIKIILNSYKLIKNYRVGKENDSEIFSLSADAISAFEPGDSKIFDSIFDRFKEFIATAKNLGLSSVKDVPYIPNVVLYIFMKELFPEFPNYSDHEFIYRTMFSTGIQRSYDKSASQQLINHIKQIKKQFETNDPLFIQDSDLINFNQVTILSTSYKKISAMEKAIFIYQINELKPIDYILGKEVKLDGIFSKAKNLDHIFPKSKFNEKQYPRVNSLANIAFSFAETNNEKSADMPSKFFASKNYKNNYDMYDRHFITQDSYELLLADNFNGFINERAQSMATEIFEHIKVLKASL